MKDYFVNVKKRGKEWFVNTNWMWSILLGVGFGFVILAEYVSPGKDDHWITPLIVFIVSIIGSHYARAIYWAITGGLLGSGAYVLTALILLSMYASNTGYDFGATFATTKESIEGTPFWNAVDSAFSGIIEFLKDL